MINLEMMTREIQSFVYDFVWLKTIHAAKDLIRVPLLWLFLI